MHARLSIVALAVLSQLGMAGVARAGEPELESPPRDWRHAPEHVVHPAGSGPGFERDEGPHTIFVNFDGATLTEGYPDNARENVTTLPSMAGTHAPFGAPAGDPTREMILNAVRQDFAGMWVTVTDVRPEGGQYTMIVVSPTHASSGKNGVASVNCGGSPLGVGFAFFSAAQSAGVSEIATTISHEAAHTFGIEHVDNTEDIMFWSSTNNTSAFVDACVPVDEVSPYCAPQHEAHCPPGQENTFQELVALFGVPNTPDGDEPTVAIVRPVDESRFAVGEAIEIEAEATDDISVTQVRLLVDGELTGTKLGPPYAWTEEGLDEGIHVLEAVARDGGGNETTSEPVRIAVGDAAFPPDPPGGEETDGGGLDGGTTGSAPDPTELDAAGEGGCNCAADPAAVGGFGPAALVFLALSLRRRRRTGGKNR